MAFIFAYVWSLVAGTKSDEVFWPKYGMSLIILVSIFWTLSVCGPQIEANSIERIQQCKFHLGTEEEPNAASIVQVM
jgi:hypothetical protein